jgi:lipopolysaccharide biosynthesis regulator YciM
MGLGSLGVRERPGGWLVNGTEALQLVGGFVAALAILVAAWAVARRLIVGRRGDGESYVEALEAIALGDSTTAIRLLRKTVEEDTENVGAYLHLGRLLRSRGDHDRALRIHRELAIRALPPELVRRVQGEILNDLVAAGRWKEARAAADELRRMGPVDTGFLRTLGRIHENLREWSDALDVFEELEKRRQEPSKRRLALYRAFIGLDYEQRGKLKEARKQYESALKLEPSLPGALLHLGEIHRKEGQLGKAIEAWKSLIRQNPNTVSLVFDRLERVTFEKDPAEMTQLAAEYERILSENPTDVSTMRALASIHRRRGDLEEAARIVNAGLEEQPEHPRLRRMHARLTLETGRPEAAVEELRKLIADESIFGSLRFTCTSCGYKSKEYLWRCPTCQKWETFTE